MEALSNLETQGGEGSPWRLATALGGCCVRALEDGVVSVILHGSLALGDFLPHRSDIDLLVVIDSPLSDEQLGALTESAQAEQSGSSIPADVRVVTRQVAATPTPMPPMEAYIRLVRPSKTYVEMHNSGEPDLVIEFSVCRAHGVSLSGPTPTELIGDIPREWVLSVGDAQLADWERIGDDPKHAELTVLTACRIWRYAEEGQHFSKTAAAEWVLTVDPTLEVVREVVRHRRGEPIASIDGRKVQALLGLVRARLAAVRGHAIEA